MKISSLKKPVKCIETNQKFESIAEAAQTLDISRSNLHRAVHQHRTINSLFLEVEQETDKLTKTPEKYKRISTKIVCNETGEVFSSQSEACRKYNIHFVNMHHHLTKWINPKTGRIHSPRVKGLTFKYLKKEKIC